LGAISDGFEELHEKPSTSSQPKTNVQKESAIFHELTSLSAKEDGAILSAVPRFTFLP